MFRRIVLTLAVSISILVSAQDYKTTLVYSCDFSSADDLKDWQMEGPGVARIYEGKLLLYSKYFEAADRYFQAAGKPFGGLGTAYYKDVEKAMRKDIGDKTDKYAPGGCFTGGHLVYWNKFKTPENYIIECDFQSLSDNALHMLMFSCSGNNGEDVFDASLKERWGLAAQYTKGDLNNYRISFYAPGRGTSHMRKCPGRRLTVKGEDLTLRNPKGQHHLKIVKYKGHIQWFINGALCFEYKDNLDDGFLKGGQTAIRLMVPAKGLYDNYRIYQIED